jgi:predicted  nucleic acid-binding Zn-ribbon protein
MLEGKDIDRIISAHRDIFVTKQDLEGFRDEIREQYSNLQKSVDAYSKQNEDAEQEFQMLKNQADRHEGWVKKIAAKNKLKLEY